LQFSYLTLRKTIGTALMVVAVAAAAFALLTGGADGAPKDKTVETAGNDGFRANKEIFSTLRFKPGKVTIGSGSTLTLTHADDTDQPHTLSIVDADEVPSDTDSVFNCGAPDTVCDEVFQTLPMGPPPPFTNGPGTDDGIDGRLDTLWVNEGESASAEVTAPAGTTLNFICAIHAWMQGTIQVK
jgi:plastocyanin